MAFNYTVVSIITPEMYKDLKCCFILIWIFICILHDENTLQMLKSGAITRGKRD